MHGDTPLKAASSGLKIIRPNKQHCIPYLVGQDLSYYDYRNLSLRFDEFQEVSFDLSVPKNISITILSKNVSITIKSKKITTLNVT
jgi:hypothetical protein